MSMVRQLWIFSKSGVTPYFAYVAVVIEQNELTNARLVHKDIIDTYFQGTHIKSSNIPNDDKGHVKRMNIISKLSDIKHYVNALVIDKSSIEKDGGLQYKQSFIKFFNDKFARQFISKYDEYHIHCDNTGGGEFQDRLKNYMEQHGHGKTLFANNTFQSQDDITEEPLIQLADFYAGCIGKYYCGIGKKSHRDTIHNVIKSYLTVDWFPKEFTNFFGAANFNPTEFNQKIIDMAIKTANDFLQHNNDEVGCEIVKLILQETHLNPFRHISSGEIKRKVSSMGISISDPISEVAKLRSKGVFIVSPIGKKGYKLPTNEREIAEFFDRLSSTVVPYLMRGHILHKILVEQSFGESNILCKEEFALLGKLIDSIANHPNK